MCKHCFLYTERKFCPFSISSVTIGIRWPLKGLSIFGFLIIKKLFLSKLIGITSEKISDEKPKAKQDAERTKLKPKLKSIKPTEVEESPLEKLKRLENGELFSFWMWVNELNRIWVISIFASWAQFWSSLWNELLCSQGTVQW